MLYSGGYSAGAPPLPIPNREVKPGRADGTAPQCGRVGRRRFSLDVLPFLWNLCSSGGEGFFLHAASGSQAARNPEGNALEDSGCIAWFPWRL